MLLNATARVASNAIELAAGARLTILIFHRVLDSTDPLSPSTPDASRFEAMMVLIRAQYNVISLGDAVRRLAEGRLPRRSLAITFDDGYADNFKVAVPILRKLGLTATFFIAVGYLDGGIMFNDRIIETVRTARGERLDLTGLGLGDHAIDSTGHRVHTINELIGRVKYMDRAQRDAVAMKIQDVAGGVVPSDLMMTSDELRALHQAGMPCGAHTVRHPILAQQRPAEAIKEIVEGKAILESLTGGTVDLFAYPNGMPNKDYTRAHVEMVRAAGFFAAVSTAPGVATTRSDLFQLPRFTPWRVEPLKFSLQLVQNQARSACVMA